MSTFSKYYNTALRYSIFHLVDLLNSCNNAKHDFDYDKGSIKYAAEVGLPVKRELLEYEDGVKQIRFESRKNEKCNWITLKCHERNQTAPLNRFG